jgi:hypothetical protein
VAKAKTKTTKHNLSEAGFSKDSREWFDIADFLMPDSNASRSFNLGAPALFRDADHSGSMKVLPAH